MISEKLAGIAAKIAADHKAMDIVVLDLRGVTSFTDFFVITSGGSDRQVRALAHSVRDEVKQEHGLSPIGVEGLDAGEWALVDYGDGMVSCLSQDVRSYYQLDRLWADAKPVSEKPIKVRPPKMKSKKSKSVRTKSAKLKKETSQPEKYPADPEEVGPDVFSFRYCGIPAAYRLSSQMPLCGSTRPRSSRHSLRRMFGAVILRRRES